MRERKESDLRVAVATTDGIVVNQHFGKARRFKIYEKKKDGAFAYVKDIETEALCDGFSHHEETLLRTAERLAECDAVLVSRIGTEADDAMRRAGIPVYVITDYIEDALLALTKYLNQNADKRKGEES